MYAATAAAWSVLVFCHAAWRIYSVLSGPPDPDTYANDWQFQVLAFAIVKLPYWLMALIVVLLAEFAIFGRSERKK